MRVHLHQNAIFDLAWSEVGGHSATFCHILPHLPHSAIPGRYLAQWQMHVSKVPGIDSIRIYHSFCGAVVLSDVSQAAG